MKEWFIRNIYRPLCRWYSGYDVRVDADESDIGCGGLGVMHETRKEFHWTAKLVRSIAVFYFKYWQWLWGIAAALILKFL